MQNKLPSLTVAFSTRGLRALGLDPAAWRRAAGLDYIVLVQEPDCDPRIGPALAGLEARSDVTVHRLDSTGLSRSRNAALDLAQGEILLIADDDVTHAEGAYEGIRAFFAAHPGSSLLSGQSFDPTGLPRKRFAGSARRLSLWNTAGVSSHELAVRRAAVQARGIRFDQSFGIGAGTPQVLGEEYIFVADCLKAGLKGAYMPLPISIHPVESSGFVWDDQSVAAARAAVLSRVFGRVALPVKIAFAIKNARRFGNMRNIVHFLHG